MCEHFDHHKVYLKTCDGGSWTGNRSQPATGRASSSRSSSDGGGGSGAALHYRGRAILDATAAALLTLGVSDATEIVVGGGSAGALGVCVLLSLEPNTLDSKITSSQDQEND